MTQDQLIFSYGKPDCPTHGSDWIRTVEGYNLWKCEACNNPYMVKLEEFHKRQNKKLVIAAVCGFVVALMLRRS
jgi:transposase-like protein